MYDSNMAEILNIRFIDGILKIATFCIKLYGAGKKLQPEPLKYDELQNLPNGDKLLREMVL
jgi:hypothetical protein